jgi:RNA polymerase sigma factor (sigma-70 family)
MFPTTVWSTVRRCAEDGAARERFVRRYEPPVRAYVRGRRVPASDVDDVCQSVFVRVLDGRVLAKADPNRGRLRNLLLAVARAVVADHFRSHARRGALETQRDDLDELAGAGAQAERDAEFDRAWTLRLAEAALDKLGAQGSRYHGVLRDHLAGIKQDRNRLWNARRRLIALIRHEIAMTCSTQEEFEEEVAYLSRFLRPTGILPRD